MGTIYERIDLVYPDDKSESLYNATSMAEVPTAGRLLKVEITLGIKNAAQNLLDEIKKFDDSIGMDYDLRIENNNTVHHFLDCDKIVTYIDAYKAKEILLEIINANNSAVAYTFVPG